MYALAAGWASINVKKAGVSSRPEPRFLWVGIVMRQQDGRLFSLVRQFCLLQPRQLFFSKKTGRVVGFFVRIEQRSSPPWEWYTSVTCFPSTSGDAGCFSGNIL